MNQIAAIPPNTLRLVLLGASAFMLYGAGRLVMGSVPARADRPTVRALLGCAIVLVLAVVAIVMGRPNIGLHLPIACATAAMTFGLGSLILGRTRPGEELVGNPSWALLAPAVAITLFGGLGGRFDTLPILSLMAFGIAAVCAWRDLPVAVELGSKPEPRGAPSAFAILLWIGGTALAALAGVLVMFGLPALEQTGVPSDPLAVVFLLAPAIIVPIFFELLPPARSLGYDGSVSVLAKFALVNLCFVLPIAALVQADAGILRGLWQSHALAATQPSSATPSTQPSTQQFTQSIATKPTTAAVNTVAAAAADATAVKFAPLPPVALRADLLVLAGAMLLLVPFAAGWQKPGGLEAGALIAMYLLGLALVMATMVMWHR